MRAAEQELSSEQQAPSWVDRAPRTVTTLMVGKLLSEEKGEQLCRVRNLSASGMLVESRRPIEIDTDITVELRCGQRLSGQVVWSHDGRAGVHFGAPINVEKVLATARGTTPSARLHRAVPRAPRFDVDCPARLVCNGVSFQIVVNNISQSGARLRIAGQPDLDRVMTVAIPGLAPRPCTVRWSRDGEVGIAFIDMVPYAELADWLGQLDVAH
ncbi:PilZ domain-containing protein [Sphingomonas sp. RS6]